MTDDDVSTDFIEPGSDETSLDPGPADVPSDYGSMLNDSLLGSVTSSVLENRLEHGRSYHSYREGRYPLPNDHKEQTREHIRHQLFKELLDGSLHLAPIGSHPQKVADLGTGFGEWATEMGDLYPSASVIGLDISPIGSWHVPPNVRFIVDDIDLEEWIHGSNFDYMHTRMVLTHLQRPVQLAKTIFDNLGPGGWVEFQEMYPRAYCDDDTMPADYCMNRFFDIVTAVLRERYRWDVAIIDHLEDDLREIGFVNIQHKVCRVPIGAWPREAKRRDHGAMFREVLGELLDVLLLKPMADGAPGMTAEQLAELFQEVRAALRSKRVHSYMHAHFICAQKPLT